MAVLTGHPIRYSTNNQALTSLPRIVGLLDETRGIMELVQS